MKKREPFTVALDPDGGRAFTSHLALTGGRVRRFLRADIHVDVLFGHVFLCFIF